MRLDNGLLQVCDYSHVFMSLANWHQFQDTLACLASEEIKLASLKTKQDDDEMMEAGADDGTGPSAAATANEAVTKGTLLAARQKIISQVRLDLKSVLYEYYI